MIMFQEVCEILKRPSLCITSESTLLELCLAWARENIQVIFLNTIYASIQRTGTVGSSVLNPDPN